MNTIEFISIVLQTLYAKGFISHNELNTLLNSDIPSELLHAINQEAEIPNKVHLIVIWTQKALGIHFPTILVIAILAMFATITLTFKILLWLMG